MDRYEKGHLLETGVFGASIHSGTKLNGGDAVVLKYIGLPRRRETKRTYTNREGEVHKALSKHPSIAEYVEHFFHEGQQIVVVMQYETDLRKMLTAEPLAGGEIQTFMKQLLEGVAFIHEKGYIHRDIKPENLFIHKRRQLKIGDFGLGRQVDKQFMTLEVMTLEYRAIELLLGARHYTNAVDLWSVGCVMAEMYRRVPLFRGDSTMNIAGCVIKVCGMPKQEDWPEFKTIEAMQFFEVTRGVPCELETSIPHACANAMALIKKFFVFSSGHRITAKNALQDKYFKEPDSSTINTEPKKMFFP